MKILKLSILSPFLFLIGCGTMNSQYDCPLENISSCISLKEMNDVVNHGEYIQTKNNIKTTNQYNSAKESKTKYMKVWVAPFKDKEGNFYDESFMYMEVKNTNNNNKVS